MNRLKKLMSTCLLTLTSVALFIPQAFAQTAAAADNDFTFRKYLALAIGFGIAIAAAGGAAAQGKAAAAGLEGIARNPGAGGRIFTTVILSLALIESLVIYSLIISFMLLGKLG